uniref:Uncharacterized protein n=1 Tax=Auxenochlorella protothecoides TaxID=3075 RepID=A0A1D1ZT75_AUXPR
MAHRLLQDPEADGWERKDFPIICETCLGPNPYVRMQRMDYGSTCHISGRPYTVFRWRPGNDARYKKTIICQEVAKAKNVCQCCLLDLDYNLPVQVRDEALGMQADQLPASDAGKEYALQRMSDAGELDHSKFDTPTAPELLVKLQRTTPYYKRNQAKICSFFVKGMCKRGAECPYRHEMPIEGPLSKQNIKDRYYGVNDPVAEKMLGRAAEMQKLTPPEDTSIATLFVGGLGSEHSEADLRDIFYTHGELKSVKKLESKGVAFVTFTTRQGAEAAAEALSNRLIIKGQRCKLLWGRPQPGRAAGGPPHAPGGGGGAGAGFPTGMGPMAAYPSMDPTQAGTRGEGGPAGKRPSQGAQGGVDAQKRPRVPVPPPGGPPPVVTA